MHHSSWRASGARPRTRGHGTLIGLVLLALVAAAVVVGPAVASAATHWRITPQSTVRLDLPAKPHRKASSSAPTPPPSAATTSLGTGHPSSGAGAGASVLTDADVPGGVDLDAGVPGVQPPPAIADDCSVDVSGGLQRWLSTLTPGTLVRPPSGACYRVDRGITLVEPQGLTIDGGTYKNSTTTKSFTGSGMGQATFTIVGGSRVTFEDLTIEGANPGGYHPSLAFEAGLALQGTAQAVIRNIAVDQVYGDGISLDPLRGGVDHKSGKILSPTTDLAIDRVVITGSGRQGITLASVDSATIGNVALSDVGIDTFDVEADQANEGAENVTINGCTSRTSNGGSFFANGGAGNGPRTGNIVVENCRMLGPQGGDAVLVENVTNDGEPRGPITFSQDSLWCGESVYVGCLELKRATVSITQSVVRFHQKSTVHENLYDAGGASTLTLVGDSVLGWQNLGQGRASSTIHVSGGSWDPAYDAATDPGIVTVSHADTPRHTARLAAHIAAGSRRAQRHSRR